VTNNTETTAYRTTRSEDFCEHVWLLEEFWLQRRLFRIAEVAQSNTYQAEALMGTQIHALSQG
jgi:hypothetical protein